MPKASSTHTATERPLDTSVVVLPVTPEVAERRTESDSIIMRNVYWSMGVGLIPVPFIDLVGVGALQIKMIAELSELYNVKFSERVARNIVAALIGTLGAVIVGRVAARTLLKFIPGVGTAIATLYVQGAIDGACTYAVGKVFQDHFETGGTIFDVDIDKAKAYFLVKFSEGKTVVTDAAKSGATAVGNTFKSKKSEPATVAEVVPV